MKNHKNTWTFIRIVLLAVAFVLLLLGMIRFCISNGVIIINFHGISSDAWLGFWGSIVGSFVTLGGIVITIHHENNKDSELRRLEVQPIIMLQAAELNETADEQTAGDSVWITYNSDHAVELSMPVIRMENIGLNSALDVKLWLSIDSVFSSSGIKMSILPLHNRKTIPVICELPENDLKNVMKEYPAHAPGMITACKANANTALARANRREDIDRIEAVYCSEGMIEVYFQDIYGNRYLQQHKISLRVIKLTDNTLLPYLILEEYSKAKLEDEKEKNKTERHVRFNQWIQQKKEKIHFHKEVIKTIFRESPQKNKQ